MTAKMAYGLTRRIFEHARDEGWLKPNDIVIDCFGGIGSTGIIGAYADLQVICCELEAKFCKLAQENFDLHAPGLKKLGHPIPRIIQGDSRKLSEVIGGADVIVSSPPYAESLSSEKSGIDWTKCKREDGSLRDMTKEAGHKTRHGADGVPLAYGKTNGQLGAMKPGSVEAIISSPPYSERHAYKDEARNEAHAEKLKANGQIGGTRGLHKPAGEHPDNLGNLKPGEVDAVVSSPPFESQVPQQDKNFSAPHDSTRNLQDSTYGSTQGNIGNDKGETFWAASKTIVSECHKILKPGGHAIWVVKAFVRKGKRVDFPGDWRRLCEDQGFTTVHEHHAMLVKETTTNGLFEEIAEVKQRKSFFRGLHETKAAWKKYWDTVPSETEKAVWRFRASMMERLWTEPPEIRSPLGLCFGASGENERDWNEHVRIDYEVVLCTQKPVER